MLDRLLLAYGLTSGLQYAKPRGRHTKSERAFFNRLRKEHAVALDNARYLRTEHLNATRGLNPQQMTDARKHLADGGHMAELLVSVFCDEALLLLWADETRTLAQRDA